jgi:hypothetical protein
MRRNRGVASSAAQGQAVPGRDLERADRPVRDRTEGRLTAQGAACAVGAVRAEGGGTRGCGRDAHGVGAALTVEATLRDDGTGRRSVQRRHASTREPSCSGGARARPGRLSDVPSVSLRTTRYQRRRETALGCPPPFFSMRLLTRRARTRYRCNTQTMSAPQKRDGSGR